MVENFIEKKIDKSKVYKGAFCDYDDTPRRDKQGIVFCGVRNWKFYLFFTVDAEG